MVHSSTYVSLVFIILKFFTVAINLCIHLYIFKGDGEATKFGLKDCNPSAASNQSPPVSSYDPNQPHVASGDHPVSPHTYSMTKKL